MFTSCDFTPRIHKEILEAQNMIREQKHDEAVNLYKRILKGSLTPDVKAKILFQLGGIYSLNFGDYFQAIKYYSEAKYITEDPSLLVRAEENIADIFFSFVKNYNKSVTSYLRLINIKPNLPKHEFYQFRLALAFSKLKMNKKALEILYEIKNKINHEYREKAIFQIGLVHFHNKHYKKSIDEWREYVRIEKRRDNIIQAKFLMANAYETMEDLKKAYNLYYSILGEYPNTKVIKNRLDSIYHRRVARKR